MNVDLYGCHLYLQKLPLETDSQLLERKRFVLKGHPPLTDTWLDDEKQCVEKLRLSKFFHYKKHKNVTYASEIENKIR